MSYQTWSIDIYVISNRLAAIRKEDFSTPLPPPVISGLGGRGVVDSPIR